MSTRNINAGLVIQRHFIGKNQPDQVKLSSGRDVDFDTFSVPGLTTSGRDPVSNGLPLRAPSANVEAQFHAYAQTDLGAKVIVQILENDRIAVSKGWQKPDGNITEKGITAYQAGEWRPFRVASSEGAAAHVKASGILRLPDKFPLATHYPTGEAISPLAVLHHEIKGHVLPQKISEYSGWTAELRGVNFENEMLRAQGLPERTLYWGNQAGLGNHTLHVPTRTLYNGLVRNHNGVLTEFDPATHLPIGSASVVLDKNGKALRIRAEIERPSEFAQSEGGVPQKVVSLSSLTEQESRRNLPEVIWSKNGYVPNPDAVPTVFSVRGQHNEEKLIRMYSANDVHSLNPENNLDPIQVAQQAYEDMARQELASNKPRGSDHDV